MNKYQDALDWFCDHAYEMEEDEDLDGEWTYEYHPCDGKELCKNRRTLQALIIKETQLVPKMTVFNAWCPFCGEALGRDFAIGGLQGLKMHRYCPNCGQALKWKDE